MNFSYTSFTLLLRLYSFHDFSVSVSEKLSKATLLGPARLLFTLNSDLRPKFATKLRHVERSERSLHTLVAVSDYGS